MNSYNKKSVPENILRLYMYMWSCNYIFQSVGIFFTLHEI